MTFLDIVRRILQWNWMQATIPTVANAGRVPAWIDALVRDYQAARAREMPS